MTYGDFKDLTRRRAFDKILCDKAFNFAEILKYNGYHRWIASMVYKFFDKKFTLLADNYASGSGIENENVSNKELAEKLHKLITRKFKKREVYSSFVVNTWGWCSCWYAINKQI